MKENTFLKELSYIKSERIRENAIVLINLLPDYFFKIPASSTGKYHPKFSLGDGGLVRHTKAAVRIAHDLLISKCLGFSFNDNEKDLIILALLIHDGLKSGKIQGKYTAFDHPILISNLVKENKNKLDFNDSELNLLTSMLESHMGEFNTTPYSKVELPIPSNKYERFVHMCDLLSSKKYLDITFRNNEIVED